MMTAGAQKTRYGYKALIVHEENGRQRTEILGRRFGVSEDGRDTVQVRAGRTFSDRADAIAFAERHIQRLKDHRDRRAAERAERLHRYKTQGAIR